MDKLSVSIITLNEEKNIGRCLKSVLPVADEIIVLDSLSTDCTKEICESFGVKFFEQPFKGYIEQKNDALDLCSYENILFLDADEALSEELQKSILEAKEKGLKNGYSFNRLTNYCGKWIHHCGWYPDRKLRLIQKSKCRWTGLNPHDKLEYSEKTPIQNLKGDLLHYSFYTFDEYLHKMEHFSILGAETYFKKNIKNNRLYIFLSPVAIFIRTFFFNLGFLEGAKGFQICWLTAKFKYMKFKKLHDLIKKSKGH